MNKNFLTFCAMMAIAAIVSQPAFAATINFGKAEAVATGLLATLRGTLASVFFAIAFVVTGFMASFNRISWAWVALVVVGAFFVFAGPAIVANLKSAFS